MPKYTISSELSVKDGLLMRGDRIVIPAELQQDILHRLHEGHQGITKCRLRARQSVWWLNLSNQIEQLIQKCPVCCKERVQRMEPLKPTELPKYPWNQVGMDLFQWESRMYLLVVDYFSRYIEIAKLNNESAAEVICHTKSIFARHGIPQCVISDNGPQFVSCQFKEFAKEYDFVHNTSSPYHPQGNGEAERAVKTIKALLKTSKDPYLSLLIYRSTPLPSIGHSPAELLMGWQLRTRLPLATNQLQPRVIQHSVISSRDKQYKEKQKGNFDKRHGTKPLSVLHQNDPVWIAGRKEEGVIKKRTGDRSYMIRAQNGAVYNRNRYHIRPIPELTTDIQEDPVEVETYTDNSSTRDLENQTETNSDQEPSGSARNVRRSDRASRPPVRYAPTWT